MSWLGPFHNQRFISLETFRKSGAGVATPVGFVEQGGALIVRTIAGSGKVKRVRANPRVRIAPSSGRGDITGAWVEATATVLSQAESDSTRGAIVAKYGLIWRAIELAQALRSRLGGRPPVVWVAIRIMPSA
ncbi:MAG: PPOX class F420-dependent oxidoreductase [Kouleothrix sp.]|jgi:PPOX class probable F420-dependent enzyme|nr:PPOX class F420-dependent oxidoreductase [Kouleothrix sp.]